MLKRWLKELQTHITIRGFWTIVVFLGIVVGLIASYLAVQSFLRPDVSMEFPTSEPWGPGTGVFTVRNAGSVAITIENISCLRTSFDGGYGPYAYLPQAEENEFYILSWNVSYTPQILRPGEAIGTSCMVLDELGLYAADVSIEFEVYYKTLLLNPFMLERPKEVLPWYPVKGVLHASQKFSGHKDGNNVDWNFGSRDLGLFQIMSMKNRPHLILMKERNDRFEFQP